MPPQGGDHPTRQAPIGTGQFQSTPPHGRQPSLIRSWAAAAWAFQSTPPHGRRQESAKRAAKPRVVSIHASAREATAHSRTGWDSTRCFNPRLRTGGDDPAGGTAWAVNGFNPRLRTGGDMPRVGGRIDARRVSIHASAREATRGSALLGQVTGVSIHASAREATFRLPDRACHLPRFNPRLRTGGDQYVIAVFNTVVGVSIHASAREATQGGGL